MKRFIPILLLFSTILASCSTQTTTDSKPTVMVSIAPQKFFVEQIADTLVRVEVMVPAGSSPETYEPTASQLKLISNSNAYFSLGLLEFELSMFKSIQKQNPNLLVIDHSKELNLIEGECNHDHHGHSHSHGHDPHVWTSPMEVKTMVKTIAKTLAQQLPDYAEHFNSNALAFTAQLDSLDRYIKTTLADTQSKKIFIFHPALTYYARDYGLTQVSLEEDGKSPSMQHFKSVIQKAQEQGATTIFIQREFDVNTAKTAAADIGGKVEVIDPLDADWLNNMYRITNMLQESLKGK